MPEANTTASKPAPRDGIPAHVLASLGLSVLLLLVYPALSLSYSWLTKKPEHSISDFSYRMDLSHASLGELLLIPGFGETLANRWLQERDALLAKHHDPLVAIENMKGIGPAKLKVIRQYALATKPALPNDDPPKSNSKSP